MTHASSRDKRHAQRPRMRSIQLGDVTVTHVPDGAAQLFPSDWFPQTTDDDWSANPEYLDDDGQLVNSLGGLLVERDSRALLIDAGLGPMSTPKWEGPGPIGTIESGELLHSLATIGRDPATIESVALTHLHPDHLGWAWHPAPGSDRPAFVNADYLVAEAEWSQRDLADAHGTPQHMLDALAPQVRTIADGDEIFPGVHARVSGGHSVGHTAFIITGDDQRLIAFGDAFHASLQISHPDWVPWNDHDGEGAVAERRWLVAELAEPNTIGFGGHFADMVFGRVEIRDGHATWEPVDTCVLS